jgi:hypothetical protein
MPLSSSLLPSPAADSTGQKKHKAEIRRNRAKKQTSSIQGAATKFHEFWCISMKRILVKSNQGLY